LYVEYIIKRYSRPTIVFDGYSSEPSTKDVTHLRRSKGIISPDGTFTSDMTFKSKKEIFLTNNNKSPFISLLAQRLRENECTVILAEEDADCLIISTAVARAQSTQVVVIGEDTDLLVLLCYHMHHWMDTTFTSDLNFLISAGTGTYKKQSGCLVCTSAKFCQ
jgi:hypothetical protein